SEALKADDGNTTPAYDSQQAVYAGMIQALKDAVAKLDPAGDGFGSGDILYGNDFTKWARFANSLRMRLAMRMSEVSAATAQAEFVAAYNAGGFQSNADNAMLEWPGPPYDPLMYEDWQTRDDFGIARTIVDTLKFLTDPRLELYAEPAAADGQYRGLQNNVAVPPLSIANYSRIGNFWRADGQGTPTPIMTYSEVLFLQAEAVARGWMAGTVATLYENAIRANMNQYDAWSPANAPTDAEINAYVAQPSVVYSNIDQIHLQKWIALYLNGGEAWFNQRRTGVPNLQPGPDLLLSRIPVRFMYPVGEQSLNKASLDAAVQRQGGGLDLVSLVWWDVQ
ncbi:MAG: SusD/RagB family nutrient-binding outer membrane lipoprotein, partial [Gemmatimonadetes bacterium]|nr:SusD/RagB family nutrient-binding outer membrane lipoprotein [Gemmatimonadota bacterium]